MSDFESFIGLDQGENQISPEALAAFQERMRKNAQQIKALRKAESKQKKKEDKLAEILKQFLRDNHQSSLFHWIVVLLELNIPAAFILSIILLGSKELQEQTGIQLEDSDASNLPSDRTHTAENKLVVYGKNESVPLKIKISIDLWGKNIFEAACLNPHKVLNTALDVEKKLKPPVYKLAAVVLNEYLESQEQASNLDNLEEFCKAMLNGIIKKVEHNLDRPELNEGEDI